MLFITSFIHPPSIQQIRTGSLLCTGKLNLVLSLVKHNVLREPSFIPPAFHRCRTPYQVLGVPGNRQTHPCHHGANSVERPSSEKAISAEREKDSS